jgi:hypothetical protein
MSIIRIVVAGLAASALALAYSGDSFAAKFEAMPKAAQETAMANMQDALPVSISAKKTGEGWEYQVYTKLNGEDHKLIIDDKGKLLAVKDGTDIASVPGAVKAAIEKESDPSKITALEKVTEGAMVTYSAVVPDAAPGKYVKVRVGADGTVKSKTQQDTDR